MAHVVPCNNAISRKETTDLILENVVQLHGLLQDIILDQVPFQLVLDVLLEVPFQTSQDLMTFEDYRSHTSTHQQTRAA